MRSKKLVATWLGLIVFAVCSVNADVTQGPLSEKTVADVPALIQALKADAMGTRWNAALLLGELGDKSAVPALMESAEKDANLRVRRRAIEALGKLGDQAALPVLIAALKDDDRFVRRDAARALGALGDKSAVPELIVLLQDSEGFVRRDAARALGVLGDTSAIPALQALLDEKAEAYSQDAPLAADEMSPVVREACFALAELGGESALSALAITAKHTTGQVRVRTAAALGQLGAAGVPLLTEALGDAERDVRLAAIAGLRQVGAPSGVPGLLEGLKSEDEPTQRAAVEALGALGDKSVIPALQDALKTLTEKNPNSRLIRVMRVTLKSLETAGQ